MYLLSQLWLYLLLACLAGLALGLLMNRACAQRRHAAQLDALQAQHREERAHAEAALAGLRREHALAAEAASADHAGLQGRLDRLDVEHHSARQALSAEVASLQAERDTLRQDHESLQATYGSRITLLNTETSRAVQLSDQLAELQARHAALDTTHRAALAQQAEVAQEAYAALVQAQNARDAAEHQAGTLREAQAASQSAAQLREQAIQQELALTQSRNQELDAELRALRLTLLVPSRAVPVPVVVRPAVSNAARLTGAELERLVLAAGTGQQPAPVEIDHQPPDDLKVIGGIGPVNERWLHAHGVRYFWQIASWSPAELAWVAHHLPNFGSRVYRENWIAQAATLAARPPMG